MTPGERRMTGVAFLWGATTRRAKPRRRTPSVTCGDSSLKEGAKLLRCTQDDEGDARDGRGQRPPAGRRKWPPLIGAAILVLVGEGS